MYRRLAIRPTWDCRPLGAALPNEGVHVPRNCVSCPRECVSFSAFVVLVGGGSDNHRGHCKGTWGTRVTPHMLGAAQEGGVSIIYPRQISKPVLRPWYARQSERVCHQANSVMLRRASIPEQSYSRTTWKTSQTPPSPQAKITPSNTPFYDSETFAFAVQLKAICYNAVIFLNLVPYCII